MYLRLPRGKTLDDIPENLLEECCQLVKQNSIQGCKENNIDIVYTKWNNLKKTSDMVVGQVGFFKQKEVRKFKVEKKKNEILNRINKTKKEEFPDLAALRERYDREMASVRKQELQVSPPLEKPFHRKRRECLPPRTVAHHLHRAGRVPALLSTDHATRNTAPDRARPVTQAPPSFPWPAHPCEHAFVVTQACAQEPSL